MKFIEPSVEYWQQSPGMEGVWQQIARATRVCYQSQQRENETDEEFVKRVILKPALIEGDLNDLQHCKFNFDKMHGAMLEHGTVHLTVPYDKQHTIAFDILAYDKYSQAGVGIARNSPAWITTNMRVIVEHGLVAMLKYISEPTENHFKRYTFNVITDIGVTREMNRHRVFSIAEQSTRYCDFSKDKFGDELTFIKPVWIDVDIKLPSLSADISWYYEACNNAETAYQRLRKEGWKPEQARQVLPLGLKTQAVYTAYDKDWQHFLALRSDGVSGKPHPNIKAIADKIKDIAAEQNLW